MIERERLAAQIRQERERAAQASGQTPEDEDAEVKAVFAYFGRAAYQASCLETGLAMALLHCELMAQTHGRFRRHGVAPTKAEWEAQFDTYMDKQHGLTLGQLIDRFRSFHKATPELMALVEKALKRRNHVAHGFFRDHAVSFSGSAGRARMIAELEADHDLFLAADEAVQAAVAPVLAKMGVDQARMQTEIAAFIAKALAEAQT